MKNNLLITSFILIFSFEFISAQDYDAAFLDSLPNNVKEDLLESRQSKDDLEAVQYRRPSTFIKKPDSDDEEEEWANRYGARIFSMMQSTMMPLNEPNFDGSYVLDFGDVLELQLVGQKSSITKIPVKRDGSINIPDIGKVYIAGLSLGKAEDLISKKIDIAFIGVESFISLVNVRDIQIIVAGNAFNPGPYTLNGNSNMFHALSVSGGPSPMGSFRNIDLIRNGEIIDTYDLYQTFIYGKTNFKSRLRSGDLIFIRPIQNSVSVEGAVNRPLTYELNDDENLSKAVFFANGLTNEADLSDISLFRIGQKGGVQKIKIYNMKEFEDLSANDNDKVSIRRYPFKTVSIRGAVANPGQYVIRDGDGIKAAITKAGGYQDSAYEFGGILENKKTKLINQLAADKLYEDFLYVLATSTTSIDSQILKILDQLKNQPASGRVNAEFDLDILGKNPLIDTPLQDGDVLTIPEYQDQVYIYGEISTEGTARYVSNEDANYYLNMKGGLTKNADKSSIYILHANGDTYRSSNKNLFLRDKKIAVYPGSIIFVPRKSNSRFLVTQTAQAYAAILGNIGVSLASISVLDK